MQMVHKTLFFERIDMRIAHTFIVSVFCMVLAVPVLAQNKTPQDGQQSSGALGVPGDAIYLDPTPFIQEVDANKDGNVSKEEWLAVGLSNDLYSRFDKQNKGYITREEMAAKYHPPAMDPEKTGKFTLAMLKAHIAKQLTQGNSGHQSGEQPQQDGQPK
jgi:hypothetical protein